MSFGFCASGFSEKCFVVGKRKDSILNCSPQISFFDWGFFWGGTKTQSLMLAKACAAAEWGSCNNVSFQDPGLDRRARGGLREEHYEVSCSIIAECHLCFKKSMWHVLYDMSFPPSFPSSQKLRIASAEAKRTFDSLVGRFNLSLRIKTSDYVHSEGAGCVEIPYLKPSTICSTASSQSTNGFSVVVIVLRNRVTCFWHFGMHTNWSIETMKCSTTAGLVWQKRSLWPYTVMVDEHRRSNR